MSDLDVVYLVRPGEKNVELRHSLRSLVNLPHREVVIAGHAPVWARNVLHLETEQRASKYQNSSGNLRAACENDDLTEDVWLFNDDFFLMEPFPGGVPVLHRGTMAEIIDWYQRWPNSQYLRGMRETRELLLGDMEPLSYEMHVPLRINRREMLRVLDMGEASGIHPFHKRSAYGNLLNLGGVRSHDVKVPGAKFDWRTSPLLSTDEWAFVRHPVGTHIRRAFRDPCGYEREGS
jgi:hypothetical protein